MADDKAAFQTIEKLYAWISHDPDGEGIIGAYLGAGWLPLVGADRARIESLRRFAEEAALASGRRVVLKVFGTGIVIDEIKAAD